MATRALFLDFDGVLHPHSATRFFQMLLPVSKCIERGRMFRYIPILYDILQKHSDVRIFVHSSWRQFDDDDALKNRLGSVADWFAGATPRDLSRFDSIQFIVDFYNLTDYCILDDLSDEFPENLPQLLLCDSEVGIYDKTVREKLKNWLEGKGLFDVA
jgi:hypothetical protein